MKYMLLIYQQEGLLDDAGMQACYQESVALTHKMHANGAYLAASPLQSVASATSVRVRDGKRLVTDGPFAETREQLGGYYLIEAANLDEAIAYAAEIPGAKIGTVEVRPIVDLTGFPGEE
jgi:hypothetical protein